MGHFPPLDTFSIGYKYTKNAKSPGNVSGDCNYRSSPLGS